MAKKTEFTPEEEIMIQEEFEATLANQTQLQDPEEVKAAVADIWQGAFPELNGKVPEVVMCDSMLDCFNTAKKQGLDPTEMADYWSIWYVGYASMYQLADRIGLEMDQEKLKSFSAWVKNCPYILFNEEIVFVSKKPVSLHLNDDGQLHNEEGKACEFRDGWGIYSINGVAVDEQIVMSPETQTVEQIREEQNEEVKRIRIERYGWSKYMNAIDAKLIDERRNDIEGTLEFLFKGNDGNNDLGLLLTQCPSHGGIPVDGKEGRYKVFQLEVDPEAKTCEEAQASISCGLSGFIRSAS